MPEYSAYFVSKWGKLFTANICLGVNLSLVNFCLSNAMHSIGQNLKSLACPVSIRSPSVRPASVDKIATLFME